MTLKYILNPILGIAAEILYALLIISVGFLISLAIVL